MSQNNSEDTPRGGRTRNGKRVPGRVAPVASPASLDLSEITTPTRQRTRDSADRRRIDDVQLDQLADEDAISPVKRLLTPREYEEQLEAAFYDENPGASDSEDEEESGIGVLNQAMLEARQERRSEDPADASAFMDYLLNYTREMAEAEAVESAELGVLSGEASMEEPVLLGAPAGWKKPGPPPDWKPAKARKGQPENFAEVDNPMHCSHSLTKGGTPGVGSVSCFLHYHNTNFYGLARNDFQIANIKKTEWKFPSKSDQAVHRKKVKRAQEGRRVPVVSTTAAPGPYILPDDGNWI